MSIDYPPGISQAVADSRYVLLGPGTPGQMLSGGTLTFGAGKTWVFKDQAGNALLTFGDLSSTAFVVPAAQGFTVTDSVGNKLMQLVDAGGGVSLGTILAIKGGSTVALAVPTGKTFIAQDHLGGTLLQLTESTAGVVTKNNTLDDGSGNASFSATPTALSGTAAGNSQAYLKATSAGTVLFGTDAFGNTTLRAVTLGSNQLVSLSLFGFAGKVGLFNSITAVGMGMPPIYGSTLQKAEVGADTSVLSYTPPATAGTYRLRISVDVSAASAATFGWTATWTDSNGTAQAPTNLLFSKAGSATDVLTIAAVAGDHYYATVDIDINNGAVPIVVKTTFAGTSVAYKITATLEQLA